MIKTVKLPEKSNEFVRLFGNLYVFCKKSKYLKNYTNSKLLIFCGNFYNFYNFPKNFAKISKKFEFHNWAENRIGLDKKKSNFNGYLRFYFKNRFNPKLSIGFPSLGHFKFHHDSNYCDFPLCLNFPPQKNNPSRFQSK